MTIHPLPARQELTPGRYTLDPDRSTVALAVKHMFGLGTVHATLRLRRGTVQIGSDPASSSATVLLDAGSFASGNRVRDRDVRGARLLDSRTYPDISFQSHRIHRDGAQFLARGDLTAHGVTETITVHVTDVESTYESLRLTGQASLRRTDFGVTKLRGMVGEGVVVTFDVTATRS